MKAIIFDASTLISFSMNGLLNEVEKLKKIFDGKFIITEDVKYEVIDRPIKVKRFELEALRVRDLLNRGILELPESLGVTNNQIVAKREAIADIANSMFEADRKEIKLIHLGEASCFALSKILSEKGILNVLAIDERTARMLSEKPENLKDLLKRKMHISIKLKKSNFKYFKDFKFIRSTEIIYVAWKKGLIEIKEGKLILDALLYALKFKGCAISDEEIKEIKNLR